MYDWLLFLHVLSAMIVFVTIAAFSAFAFGATNDGRVLSLGNVAWNVSGAGLLVFGVWLALYVDGYSLLDGWILGALILFAATTELGRRAQVGYAADAPPNYASSAALMHWLRTIAIVAILFLMIYKPGA